MGMNVYHNPQHRHATFVHRTRTLIGRRPPVACVGGEFVFSLVFLRQGGDSRCPNGERKRGERRQGSLQGHEGVLLMFCSRIQSVPREFRGNGFVT